MWWRNDMTRVLLVAVVVVVSANQLGAETPLKCGGPGYTAKYTPATPSFPPTVDVTFRGARPTSAAAEAALRKCMTEVVQTMFVTADVLGEARYSRTGRDNDDARVVLPDGSQLVVYDIKARRIVTWNERQGVKPATTTQGVGYFTEYQEQKILVQPGGKFAMLAVVFAKIPTEKVAYDTAIEEIRKAIRANGERMATTAVVYIGPKDDKAARRPMRGADNKSIMVHFDPKRGPSLKNAVGIAIGTAQ
jgi:hypothetical protein